MTTYCYSKDNDEIIVEVKGHTEYSTSGTDIVCASISTACIMTANLLDTLNLRYNIKDLICEDGYFKLQVKVTDKVTLGVVENLIDTLDSLKGQYPKYIKYKS